MAITKCWDSRSRCGPSCTRGETHQEPRFWGPRARHPRERPPVPRCGKQPAVPIARALIGTQRQRRSKPGKVGGVRPRGPRPTLGILRPPQCPPKPSSRSRKWRRRTTRTRASEPHAPWRPRPCPAARGRRRAARPRRHDHGQRGKRADTPGEQARQGPFAAHGVRCGHGRAAGRAARGRRQTPVARRALVVTHSKETWRREAQGAWRRHLRRRRPI